MKAWIRFLMAASAALATQAFGQGYPNKPVHVIISFTPGSSTDIVGRIVSQKLADLWNQPAVPENRAGAGGSIGSAIVAKAAPDGYTLLINSNAHSVNPAIYAKLPYDTLKDFTEIAPLAIQPNVFVVPTEKFIAATKIKVTEVPFKGTPEVIAAMLSGDVQAYWAPISAAMALIKGGKLRPLAVSTAQRNPQLPDVRTPAEAGVPGAESPLWFGLWGPAGMQPELVNKINADVRKALADPAVKERLIQTGNDTMDMSPQEFAKLVRSEMEDYARVLNAAGVKP